MDKKVYRKLMIAGLVPWNGNILKKHYQRTEEQLLLRDGWEYVNITKTLTWKNDYWRLLYKIIDKNPRKLECFEQLENGVGYQYIEFKAINIQNHKVELYAYGNFLKGTDRPYVMKNRQVIRL